MFFTASAFSQSSDLHDDLKRSFIKFDLVRLDNQTARRVESRQPMIISTSKRNYELNLTPRDLRAESYRAEDTSANGIRSIEKSKVTTFRGKIAGESASEVRLTIDEGKIEGYFFTAGEKFYIEPARKFSSKAGAEDFVVFEEKDLLKTDGFLCHSDIGEKIERGKEMIAARDFATDQSLKTMELATEADFEYVNLLGGTTAANNEILSILNMAEGVFQTELNLTISVTYQHTWSTPDVYSGVNAPSLLNSFKAHWRVNFPTAQYPRDAAHLFTGKAYSLSQGYAMIGTVCRNPAEAYGLSGMVNWAPAKFLITTHELGHNLGANHVETAQSCANSLMNAALSGGTPLSFCGASRTEIINFIAVNGSCLSVLNVARTVNDFDGDGKSDVSVFRPSTGIWYLNRSLSGFTGVAFGTSSDKIVPADYDGDGKTDVAVYRGGIWYLQRSSQGFTGISFGDANDIPAPADYTGDGQAEIAVFRPSNGTWYTFNLANNQMGGARFGQAGDKPVAADYDGDGKADVAVYRRGLWYLQRSTLGFTSAAFGDENDNPVSADYDGDGKSDVAVFRPSNGTWYLQRSSQGFAAAAFGATSDVPSAADYDGDSKADIAVFRPSSGTWYLQRSSLGFTGVQFGADGDVPVQSAYVQ